MLRPWILDDTGEPTQVDVLTWARWFEAHSMECGVLRDAITRRVSVSTVFLGIDHSFGRGPTPLLWETMIFGGPFDLMQQRYTSKLAALRGHAQFVRLVTCYCHEAPRRVKKALLKWVRVARLRPAEQRRVDRALARIRW